MKGKLLGFGAALLSLSIIGVTQLPAQAVVDNSRDCDKWAVIYCGTMNADELRKEYDTNGASSANGSTKHQGDIRKVFAGMGISRGELNGTFKNGTVYQDGRVVVDGKTVATGATMAARGLGGSTIAGTSAQKVSVSKMGSAQTALVKFDSNGRFLFAVMKPCGNVVVAKPTKPTPKPSAVCVSLSKTELSRTSFRFTAKASVKDGAKVKSYTYTVSKDGKVLSSKTITNTNYGYTQTTPGTYTVRLTVNTTVGAKTANSCVQTFTIAKPPVKDIKVCEIETGKTITIKESQFDSKKHSKDFKDCEMTVCVKETKTWETIKKYEFDSSKHSTNPADCKDVPKPVEVCNPETGEVITVPKEDEDKYVPVDSPACKDIEVCVLETKTKDTIKQAEFDSKLHTTDFSECEETPVTPPAELPETGPAETVLSVLGLGSVIAGAGYYLASRRQV